LRSQSTGDIKGFVLKVTLFKVLIVGCLTAAALIACGPKADAPGVDGVAVATEPARLSVTPDIAGLVLRYRDPATGLVASATRVEEIPEAARATVVIYHPTEPSPPGADFVANLQTDPPWEATAVQGFAFAAPPLAAKVEAAKAAEVVLFTTEWCGYCKKARGYFESHKIPFSEYDLENDRKAEAKLGALAKEAGVPRESMSGVPIIFIGKQLLRGWDEGEAKRLLAKAGR